MDNYKFICKYICNGAKYTMRGTKSEHISADISVTDNGIKVTLVPNTKVELVSAKLKLKHQFNKGEVFFGNGYQSWSTSKEYNKSDIQLGVMPIIPFKQFRQLAGRSTDIWFCKDEIVSGVFHSHAYTYFKNHYANDKDILFYGSLAENTGYTVFHMNTYTNSFVIRKDVEGSVIDGNFKLFDIMIKKGSMDAVFDNYFDTLQVPTPKYNHLAGYTSWYNYTKHINEEVILKDLEAISKISKDVNIFQIDDGYETYVGDWLDLNAEKFPNGMKPIADSIHNKGYMAGIWIAPFNVQQASRVYKEHPDWVIKDNKGNPFMGCPSWGGAYTLDIYNTEARAYIKHFFDVILNEWGYDMVKLDFLYSQAQMPRNGKNRGTIMREAMEFLRECCGQKLILGCGVPLAPAYGLIDACRVGCDGDEIYGGKTNNKIMLNDEISSAQMSINNAIFRRQLNHRVFLNDPDVFYMRDYNLTYTAEQKHLLGLINHICGDVLFMSDCADAYSPETKATVQKLFKKSKLKVVDATRNKHNYELLLQDEAGKRSVLKFNLKTGEGNQMDFIKNI